MPPTQADMIEATRLTRAGRLAEATALLRGQAAPVPTDRTLIDMEPPSVAGQAWTAPAGLGGLQGLPTGLNLANLRGKLPGQAPVVDVPPGARFEERVHSGPAGAPGSAPGAEYRGRQLRPLTTKAAVPGDSGLFHVRDADPHQVFSGRAGRMCSSLY